MDRLTISNVSPIGGWESHINAPRVYAGSYKN